MPSSTSTCGRIAWPSGYKNETRYSLKSLVTPTHGDGPRCEVDYNSNDDGPWTTLRIKDVTRDKVEDYTTAMPRYYAIPLILINKMLAYVEAQCRPDGTPLPGIYCKLGDLRDYSYLWRLRENFLKAIFAMNHDIRLDEQWRWEGIQGFLHRMYRRFGHDPGQRLKYSKEEMAAGRRPYCIPDLAKMDWEAYLREDITTNTRLNAFLWNRVSQGFSREVKDAPPFEGWRRWREGDRDHELMAFRTSACSPARELPGELSDDAAATAPERTQTRRQVRKVARRPAAAAARVPRASTSSSSENAARSGVGVNDDEEKNTTVVLTATLAGAGPSRLQEWDLPFPTSEQPSPEASQATSTSSHCPWPIDFTLNAPLEDMRLTTVQCTFDRIEDVRDFKTTLKVVYVSNPS